MPTTCRIVSNAEGVRLTANAGEVTPSDVGASVSDVYNLCWSGSFISQHVQVLLTSGQPDEQDEKQLWSFVTEI
jgi:hypothetical protein